MARHHGRFKLAREFKNGLHATLRSLTWQSRILRHAFKFYPTADLPEKVEWIERTECASPLSGSAYEEPRALLNVANVDTLNVYEAYSKPLHTLRAFAWVEGASVGGHTFKAIDNRTARVISLTGPSKINWNFAHPTLAISRRIAGPAIAVPFYKNYYHLLVDSIFPAAYALKRIGRNVGPVTLLASKSQNPAYQACLSALMQMSASQVSVLSPFDVVAPDQLLVGGSFGQNAELGFCYPEIIDELRSKLLDILGGGRVQSDGRPLFLKRGFTKIRRVSGELELARRLSEKGFEILEPRWGNFLEQISKSWQAPVVVGVHGAGLANVLWMQPDAQVFEVMADNARKRTYLHLTAVVGARYRPVFGGVEFGRQHFEIDPNIIASEVLS